MNRKFKFISTFFIMIAGLLFTQDVEAAVCTYSFDHSGTTKMVQVSYTDTQLCYDVNNSKTDICFNAKKVGETGNITSTSERIMNNTLLETWKSDPDGCLDLYVATGVADRTVTVYAFTTTADKLSIGYHVEATPKVATFRGKSETVRVTINNLDGTTDYLDVVPGDSIDMPTNSPMSYEGKIFECWTREDGVLCIDNWPLVVKNNMTLKAKISDEVEIPAGFLGLSNKEVSCGGTTLPYGLPYMISRIINLLKIATPIILIIMGLIDFGKAVVASKEEDMRKATASFTKRAIAAAIVFFVIAIVQFAFGIVDDEEDSIFTCFDCFINGEENCIINEVGED